MNKSIDVRVEIPDSEFCNGCDFMTKIISLNSEPECILFKEKLKYVCFDRYAKCNDCIFAGSCEDNEES